MITPPNFGYVEDGIYRCGSPDTRSFGFLASLKLRTTILLTDSHDEAFVRFLQEHGVNILCPLGPSSPLTQRQQPPYPSYGKRMYGAVPESGAMGSTGVFDSLGGGGGEVHRRGVNHKAGGGEGGNPDPAEQAASLPFNESGASTTPPLSPALAEDRNANVTRFLNRNSQQNYRPSNHSVAGSPSALAAAPGFGGKGVYDDWKGNASAMGGDSATGGASGANVGSSSAFHFPASMSGHSPDVVGRGGGGGGGQRGLMTLSESVVVGILHVLLDPKHYPVLITCPMGRYRTGIVCGCLRKLQRWNLVSILEEYRRFAGDKGRAENEDFIELFDKDLVNLELEGGRQPTVLYQ